MITLTFLLWLLIGLAVYYTMAPTLLLLLGGGILSVGIFIGNLFLPARTTSSSQVISAESVDAPTTSATTTTPQASDNNSQGWLVSLLIMTVLIIGGAFLWNSGMFSKKVPLQSLQPNSCAGTCRKVQVRNSLDWDDYSQVTISGELSDKNLSLCESSYNAYIWEGEEVELPSSKYHLTNGVKDVSTFTLRLTTQTPFVWVCY